VKFDIHPLMLILNSAC